MVVLVVDVSYQVAKIREMEGNVAVSEVRAPVHVKDPLQVKLDYRQVKMRMARVAFLLRNKSTS